MSLDRFDVVIRIIFESNEVYDCSRAVDGFSSQFEIGTRDSRREFKFFIVIEEQFDIAGFFGADFGDNVAIEVRDVVDVMHFMNRFANGIVDRCGL